MAGRTYFNTDFFFCGLGFKRVTTGTCNLAILVLRVYVFFHLSLLSELFIKNVDEFPLVNNPDTAFIITESVKNVNTQVTGGIAFSVSEKNLCRARSQIGRDSGCWETRSHIIFLENQAFREKSHALVLINLKIKIPITIPSKSKSKSMPSKERNGKRYCQSSIKRP